MALLGRRFALRGLVGRVRRLFLLAPRRGSTALYFLLRQHRRHRPTDPVVLRPNFRFQLLHPYFRLRRRARPFLLRRRLRPVPVVFKDPKEWMLGQDAPRSERYWSYGFLPTPHFGRAIGVVRSARRALAFFADSSSVGLGYKHLENLVDYFRVPFDVPAFRKGSRILREPVSISYLRAYRRLLRLILRASRSGGLVTSGLFSTPAVDPQQQAGPLPFLTIYERWRRLGLDNISHIGMGRR